MSWTFSASGGVGEMSGLVAVTWQNCGPPRMVSATSGSSVTRWPGSITSSVCSKRFWSFGSPDSWRSPSLSLARTITSRIGPSPGFETVIRNSTGFPLRTLAELTVCSTLSLGSRTSVRDLLPARIVTVAAWSNDPTRFGRTRRTMTRSEAAGTVARLQNRKRVGPLLGRLAAQEVEAVGELVADHDADGVGRAGVPDDDLERGLLVDVERRGCLDLDRQPEGLPPQGQSLRREHERVGLDARGRGRRLARHLAGGRQRVTLWGGDGRGDARLGLGSRPGRLGQGDLSPPHGWVERRRARPLGQRDRTGRHRLGGRGRHRLRGSGQRRRGLGGSGFGRRRVRRGRGGSREGIGLSRRSGRLGRPQPGGLFRGLGHGGRGLGGGRALDRAGQI